MTRRYYVPHRLIPSFEKLANWFLEAIERAFLNVPAPSSFIADTDPSITFAPWLKGPIQNGNAIEIRYLNAEQFRFFAPLLLSLTIDTTYGDEGFTLVSILCEKVDSLPDVVSLFSAEQLSVVRLYLEIMSIQGNHWARKALDGPWKEIAPSFSTKWWEDFQYLDYPDITKVPPPSSESQV